MTSINIKISEFSKIGVIMSSLLSMILSLWYDVNLTSKFLFISIALSLLGYIAAYRRRMAIFQRSLIMLLIVVGHYVFFLGTIKFVDMLILVATICYLTIIIAEPLSDSCAKLLRTGSVVASVLFLLFSRSSTYYTYQGWLQFNFVNTNTSGLVMFCLMCYLLLGSYGEAKKWLKCLYLILAAGDLYLVWQSSSRGSFIAAVLVVLLSMLNIWKKNSYKYIKIMQLSPIWMIPIITVFAVKYLDISNVLMGKTVLSGRERLWKEALFTVWTNISGLQNQYTTNLNVFLRMIYLSGVIGAIWFFVFLVYGAKKVQNESNSDRILECVICFSGIMVQQCFESVLVSGTFCIGFFAISMLGLRENQYGGDGSFLTKGQR